MRTLFTSLLLGITGLAILGINVQPAQAQFYPYGYPGGYYYPGPYYPTAPLYNYNYRYSYSPYGYRSSYFANTPPDLYGNYLYQYNYNYARPYAVGPWHSVYWDPYLNRYIYLPH